MELWEKEHLELVSNQCQKGIGKSLSYQELMADIINKIIIKKLLQQSSTLTT